MILATARGRDKQPGTSLARIEQHPVSFCQHHPGITVFADSVLAALADTLDLDLFA
jgi:hypothetical protein